MTIHKAGKRIILNVWVFSLGIIMLLVWMKLHDVVTIPVSVFLLFASFFTLSFFRKPKRVVTKQDNTVLSPADGTIVTIEEVFVDEYLQEKRMQVSIFMSVWNVHINWFPCNGMVTYKKYHPGRYYVARYPKSSELNERYSVGMKTTHGDTLLMRQIAGAVARRIESYASEQDVVQQGDEMGFIKFGSRVDVFLPVTAKINVKLHQKVKGTQTILAYLK